MIKQHHVLWQLGGVVLVVTIGSGCYGGTFWLQEQDWLTLSQIFGLRLVLLWGLLVGWRFWQLIPQGLGYWKRQVGSPAIVSASLFESAYVLQADPTTWGLVLVIVLGCFYATPLWHWVMR